MNKRLLFALLCLVFSQINTLAQVTPPCSNPPPPGAEACPTTCVYCNFDGYMGINNGSPSGGNVVCGQIFIHNDQWFGFVAGTDCITINIATSNCQDGNGLQAAFFDDCDADAIVCNPGSGGGGGGPLELSYCGFVPGQTYYLMVDGWTGDICNYEIEVLSGSVSPPAPSQPTTPQGPTQVCPGAVVTYTIPDVPGAGYYQWTAPPGSQINGGSNNVSFQAPEGTTITVTFGNVGGNICVKVGNACFAPLQACLNVVNQPIPPTVRPDVIVCFEDLPFVWDEQPFTTIGTAGTFNLTSAPYDSYLGCDSLVKQKITIKNKITTNIGFQYICEGSCFTINGNNYCNAGGPFQEIFQSYQDCDSVVQFSVIKVPAVAVIGGAQPIDCNSPALTLTSAGSTTGPGVTYTWKNSSWVTIGNQTTQNITMTGTYHLIVTNNFGTVSCKDTASVTVTGNTTPPGASATGGNLTCVITSVMLQGSSPTNGVNFQWTGPGITPANQNLQNPTVTLPGTYNLTVTNPANGCTSTASADVTADNTPPTASATGGTITCLQASINLTSTTNAPTPSFKWAGPGINAGNQNLQNPTVTAAGNYTVTVTNTANGCTATATAAVIQNTSIPTVNAGTDKTITCLVLNVTLNGSGDGGGAPIQFLWTGAGINAGNQNSPTPTVNQADTYILTVTNTANGCFRKDTVVVTANVTEPTADAGSDKTITCSATTVTLGGTGSSQGPNFTANWGGPGINTGNQNQYNPVVNQSGTYVLTITNITNGCTKTDNVVVNINTTLPTANAGTDKILTCSSNNGVTLNGSGTPSGITYLWSGPGIGANNETQQNPVVSQPGTYNLQVTDPINDCTATDQVIVTQNANVPAASAGPDLQLNCTVSSVNIDGSGSASGVGITYQWSGPGITPANQNLQSPQNITLSGTYSLTVTNTNNNCDNTDVMVVELDTLHPTASAGANLILNCFNNATDTLDASASSQGTNFTLIWSGPGITPANQNDLMPIVSAAGLYSVTVTNTDNNCTSTDQATVTNDLVPPVANAGPDKTIDCVTTSTSIGGNSSSGANFSYKWTGPGITPANENLAQPIVSINGNYSLVVTNTTNGCTSTDAVLVITNAVFPTASAGTDGLLTCAQPTMTLDGSGSSSGANIQPLWSGPGITPANQNQFSPNVTVPGTYILTITNTSNSCVSKDTAIVDENKVIPAASAGLDLKLDCQIIAVVLDGSLSDTGATLVYLWSGPDITPANQNEQSPTVNQPGNYSLVVTDSANGCFSQDETVVTQDIALPTASAGVGFTLTCAQNSQAIDGSGSSAGANFEYTWQGPDINTSNFNVQNPVVADSGTYILIVTNIQNKCTATDQVYVALDADLPIANAGIDKTLTCQNDTLQLDGSQSQTGADMQYAWSGPGIVAGESNLMSPNVFVPGAYTLLVTNTTTGCTKTDIVNVGEDKIPPVADAGTDQVLTCANSATGVPLSSGASSSGPGFTLLWSGPGITPANQNSPNPTVLVTGIYTILITNTVNGCTNTDEVEVLQDQNLPTADAGSDQTLTCAILDVILDGSASSSPSGTIQYQWTGPGINAGNQNQAMPLVTVSGAYSLTVTNPLTGCKATDNVTVNLDNQPPQVTTTGDIITCSDPLGTLTATSSLPNSTFKWAGPGINSSNMNLATLEVGEPGQYSVTVTAPNGCTGTSNVEMQVDANFPDGAAEGAELNCYNNGVAIISGEVNTPGATFSWTGPNGFQSSSLAPTVTQIGTYTFTIVSPNGCPRPISVEVTQNFNPPQANASVPEKLDCNTTSLTISGGSSSTGSSFSYSWTTVGGNIVSGQNGLFPVVDAAGQYTLLIIDNINGCRDSTTVLVEIDPSVPTGLDLLVRDIRCFGDKNGSITVSDVIGGTEPFIFTISGGSGSPSNQFTGLPAGAYTISLLDGNGCVLDSVVTISEPSELFVELGPDIEVQLGEDATVTAEIINSTPLASVTWNYAPNCDSLAAECLTFTYTPPKSYRHEITVIDSNGCKVTDRVTVIVKRTRLVYIPNVFHPGSADPQNYQLMIQGGTGVVKVHTWQIFDRWGSSVFEVRDFPPNDPAYAWDGRVKGDDGNTGVYTWFAEIEFIDGEIELFKGDVTIIR